MLYQKFLNTPNYYVFTKFNLLSSFLGIISIFLLLKILLIFLYKNLIILYLLLPLKECLNNFFLFLIISFISYINKKKFQS